MGRGNTSKTTKLWCPCCGYDLSALPPTWTSTCPTQGICSECGEHFPWSDIFHPENARTPWLYEYAPHWWCFKSLFKTYLVALVPPMLLRRLRFEKHVCWKRFAIILASLPYLVFPLVLLSDVIATFTGRLFYSSRGSGFPAYPESIYLVNLFTFPFRFFDPNSKEWESGWLMDSFYRDYLLISLSFAAFMSIHVLGYKIPKIPTQHLARLFLYSMIPASCMLIFQSLLLIVALLLSALFYLMYASSPIRWPTSWIGNILEYISTMQTSTVPDWIALLWLPWFWAIVYRKHLKLVRWKYFYLNGLLVALIFYFLFRGLLATPL